MDIRKDIENELYAALFALENNDLQTARGCCARAHSDIIEYWQQLRSAQKEKSTE